MSEMNANCAYQYTVKRGDSFYLIAHRTGVRLRDLLEANPNIPPARLTVGDVLCIPFGEEVRTPANEQQNTAGNTSTQTTDQAPSGEAAEQTPAEAAPACPPSRRTVVQNDQNAADLMVRYGLSYHTLQNANPGADLEHIHGGDVLCIPQENTPCTLATTVTLGEGDTLQSVADAHQVPIGSLLRANPCLAPADFRAGVTIRMPE